MLESIRALHIPHPESDIAPFVTAGLGLAFACPAPREPETDLVLAADKALYSAKSRGRNQIATAA